MKQLYNDIGKFSGVYRGFVIYNDDPLVKGRLKIFVPGVYPDKYMQEPNQLPWALPAMPSFGGNAPADDRQHNSEGIPIEPLNQCTGWCSVPHDGSLGLGAQIYVFFEAGDINFPVYFAFAQSGDAWLSEHPNQHVFRSDNVTVRIDENTDDERSTCKYDSYTSHNFPMMKESLKSISEDHKWNYDESTGTIKDIKTRVNIDIEAKDLNAVNLNIHGNVNMKIDGNWFIEHIGNRYEYHKGNTYIQHDGSTFIEEKGIYNEDFDGDKTIKHLGNYTLTHIGDTDEIHLGTVDLTISNDVNYFFNENFNLNVAKDTNIDIKENLSIGVTRNTTLTVLGRFNESVDEGKSFMSIYGEFTVNAHEKIDLISDISNITIQTNGEFDLMEPNGFITQDGFNNIGTRGNIQIISTFGNINIQCKKDDTKAKFDQKSIVIPWNPGFMSQVLKLSDGKKQDSIIEEAETYFSTLDFSNLTDPNAAVKMFTSLFTKMKSLLIYDGLPVFLPTKMIIQNPNISTPRNENDISWIPNFRSESTDWRKIKPSSFWKLPGRMMGNINIETWSGDINIKAKSELGCAGNINIEASESAGTLPGYKIGTVNIKANGRKRIYPDPRDLFLDSDYQGRLNGQFTLFTHGTNYLEMALKIRDSVLPPVADQILKQVTGCIFKWKTTDYDQFYLFNAINIITKGDLGLSLTSLQSERVKKLVLNLGKNVKLGCPRCISDYLLGLPGVQDLCYATSPLKEFGIEGLHAYGFQKFNPFDWENPRGTFNLSSLNVDKFSMGDGHAIEEGFINKDFTGPNIGSININANGDFKKTIGRNYHLTANNDISEGRKTVSYTYKETWYDYVWPTVIKKAFETVNDIWNNSLGLFATIDQGDFKFIKFMSNYLLTISTQFKFLNFPLPENQFLVLGYTAEESESLGGEVSSYKKVGNSSTIDFGFDFENAYEMLKGTKPITTGKLEFTDYDFVEIFTNDAGKFKRYEDKKKHFSLELSKPFNFNINIQENYYDKTSYDQNEKTITGTDIFNLDWNIDKTYYFPDYYWKKTDTLTEKQGHGYNFTRKFETYKKHTLVKDTNILLTDVLNSFNKPIESYTDLTETVEKSTSHSGSNGGDSRNIIMSEKVDSNNEVIENITWKSAVNAKILTLVANGDFQHFDKDTVVSSNSILVNLIGENVKKPDDEETLKTKNEFVFNATGFENNQLSINNGIHNGDKNNSIEINNGFSGTTEIFDSSDNEIIFNNGLFGNKSKNIFEINNGVSSTKSSNYSIINNGNISDITIKNDEKELNEIILTSCPNTTVPASYTIHTERFMYNKDKKMVGYASYINEFATVDKRLTTGTVYVISNANQIHTNDHLVKAASNITLNSPKIEQNFKIVDKPIDKPGGTLSNPDSKAIFKTYKYYLNQELTILKEFIKNIFK